MKVADVKALASELRPHIEAALDSAEILKGLAAVAREKGIGSRRLRSSTRSVTVLARMAHRIAALGEAGIGQQRKNMGGAYEHLAREADFWPYRRAHGRQFSRPLYLVCVPRRRYVHSR